MCEIGVDLCEKGPTRCRLVGGMMCLSGWSCIMSRLESWSSALTSSGKSSDESEERDDPGESAILIAFDFLLEVNDNNQDSEVCRRRHGRSTPSAASPRCVGRAQG